MTDQIPIRVSVAGLLCADPVLRHDDAGEPYVSVGFTAEPPPEYEADGRLARSSVNETVYCALAAYGTLARCLARRFRRGDAVLAVGRVSEHDPGTFVAHRISHDAARGDYAVARTGRHRRERALRRRRALIIRAEWRGRNACGVGSAPGAGGAGATSDGAGLVARGQASGTAGEELA